jgi:hypothetical protein
MALLVASSRQRGRLARRVALLAGLSLPAGEAAAQLPAPDLAQQVRAAYLLNFTRYVDWPSRAFAGPDDPVILCVMDPGGFVDLVRGVAEGRRSRGRPVRVLAPDTPSQAAACHLAYVAGPEAHVRRWLAALGRAATLTVGEGAGFLAHGGAIAFVVVEETIRFEIDQRPARRAGLRISSRVLALATRLHGEGDAR